MSDAIERGLDRLGGLLEQAAVGDLTRAARRGRRRRRVVWVAVGVAVLGSGVGVAASLLVDDETVATSLPAGTFALTGTDPICTAVRQGIEYDCTLARPPAPEVLDWNGTVEPTVDATHHVNGGCRSQNSEGTRWRCYLGREAVTQRIIDAGLLGEPSAGPGRG